MMVWALMQTSLGWEKAEKTREGCIIAAFHFENGVKIPNRRIPGFEAMYGQKLHGLVQGCLQINPDDQVGVSDSMRRLQTGLEKC